jgi:hypothetical protein
MMNQRCQGYRRSAEHHYRGHLGRAICVRGSPGESGRRTLNCSDEAKSYLALGAGPQAAVEFQRILDHRGSDPFSAFHAVAPLGLARADAMAGNLAASAEAYERFLTNWRDADADVPVLRDAREELRRVASGRGR